jgi:hypothetical protein
MENTTQFNPNLVSVPRSAFLIEKVHRCADCPIRRLAAKQPQSVFAQIHNWHKTWWPGWKSYRASACALAAGAGTQTGK